MAIDLRSRRRRRRRIQPNTAITNTTSTSLTLKTAEAHTACLRASVCVKGGMRSTTRSISLYFLRALFPFPSSRANQQAASLLPTPTNVFPPLLLHHPTRFTQHKGFCTADRPTRYHPARPNPAQPVSHDRRRRRRTKSSLGCVDSFFFCKLSLVLHGFSAGCACLFLF